MFTLQCSINSITLSQIIYWKWAVYTLLACILENTTADALVLLGTWAFTATLTILFQNVIMTNSMSCTLCRTYCSSQCTPVPPSVFEIALGTLVDIRSTNVPTFGGPALFLVDQRHMQYGDEKDLIMISQGNATWNTKKNQFVLDSALENYENLSY